MLNLRFSEVRTAHQAGFPDRAGVWPRCGTAQRAAKAAGTVLVVDDEESIRDVVAAVLRRHRYRVYKAADAFQALWLMQQRPVDLVVTDIDLPVCSGFELAYRIRDLWPRMPILFVSGGLASSTGDARSPWEPCAVLAIPFATVTLMDRIKRLMAGGNGPVEAGAYAG